MFEAQCALIAKEIEAMVHLKHANLVRYLACEREGNILRIFQEYVGEKKGKGKKKGRA